TVRLPIFEGPLDLLLHLIKKNEVQITDIPIANITDQYLAMLEELPELNLDGAGEYLVMAATLMYIKSRMLLPSTGEDEEAEEDPRAALVQQLVEYQRFREVAVALGERSVSGRSRASWRWGRSRRRRSACATWERSRTGGEGRGDMETPGLVIGSENGSRNGSGAQAAPDGDGGVTGAEDLGRLP